MILALLQRLFRARISRQCAWISIGITMRRCRRRITSLDRKCLCVYCTNSGFAFSNSSIPCLLVHMILALVQRLFRTRIRRENAWIFIGIIMRRCRRRITSWVRKGFSVYCTNSGFAFSNSSIPCLLVDMMLALLQRLFRGKISCQNTCIAINFIMRRCNKRITSQVRKGLCAYCTNAGFAFSNSSIPCLLVDMILALVQRLFLARISSQSEWISIGIIMRRCSKRITSQVRKGLCVYCTNSGFAFSNSSIPCLLVDMILALLQRLFRGKISRQSTCIAINFIMRRCSKRITSQVRKGLCAYCTNAGFAFSNSSIPCLLVDMILALVQRLFLARISSESAWISIGIIMRRCSKRIISQVRKGLCVYCTNSGFAFPNSSIPCLFVHMILALVERLFRARISRHYAWISIGIIMRRCSKRITSQVRKGLCVDCTNSGFAISNSSIPCLLVDVILALVQRLFRAKISLQCAWISNGGILRLRSKRITSQVPKGLCVYCTNSGFAFSNSSIPCLFVHMILALVQRLFRARISRQCAWISIGIIMRRCSKRTISQVRKGLCVYCTNSGFAFSNSSIPCLLVDMILVLVQRLFRARISRQSVWISIGIIMRRCSKRIT